MPTLSSRFVLTRQNCCSSIATLFAFITFAGNVQVAFSIPSPPPAVPATLTLTEVSSTQLDWSWDDGSGSGSLFPKPTVTDAWGGQITGPALSITSTISLIGAWQEPGSSLFNNVTVTFSYNLPNKPNSWSVAVGSDQAATRDVAQFDDGTTITNDFFGVRFIDQAAASEAPEGGTTVIMLSLAVGCLELMRRRLAAT